MPLRADFEHALVVCAGAVTAVWREVSPGRLAYLGPGRGEIDLSTATPVRVMLLRGVPFDEPMVMWWNYVARSREEIVAAHAEWTSGSERSGRSARSFPASWWAHHPGADILPVDGRRSDVGLVGWDLGKWWGATTAGGDLVAADGVAGHRQ
ncbi:MAG: pirin-like C-terminal cupin domain-containing protein [Acidimicrobiales bacterium]